MKLTSSFSAATVFLMSMLLFFSCVRNNDSEKNIEGVILDITHAELIPGETVVLTAKLLPYNTVVDENTSWDDDIKDYVFWKSDNPGVAQVDGKGLVTAKGVGTCTVRFVCGALAAECKVTVCSFNKEVLYGLWGIENIDDRLLFTFEDTGYLNDERFFDWSFDGMRLSMTYKGSPIGQIDKKMIVTSVNASKIKFYYSDDKDKKVLSMKRIPMVFEYDDLVFGMKKKPGLGDSLISVVDLGLPSGTMWASCNLGAAYPDEDGQRYAWAETTPKKSYSLDEYVFYDKDNLKLTGYADGQVTEMQAADDPVSACLGEEWHTPSVADVNELFENCNILYSVISGKEGFVLIPKNTDYNDRRLFIPFSMSSETMNVNSAQSSGLYERYGFFWTSSLSPVDPFKAFSLCINMDDSNVQLYRGVGPSQRHWGLCIRPVYVEKK